MTTCPTHGSLRHLLDGVLGEVEQTSVMTHIEDCRSCQDVLEQLTAVKSPSISPEPSSRRGTLNRLRRTFRKGDRSTDGQVHLDQPEDTEWPSFPGYVLEGILGRGGMGVVYEAVQLRLNRRVALKTILAAEQSSPEQRVRLQTEGQALARLQHPNIVQVYEVGCHEKQQYLVMEYVAGGNLADCLTGQPLSARAAAELLATLARAVQHAHEQGVTHRDLKPANILLQQEGGQRTTSEGHTSPLSIDPGTLALRPKIADFGLAKQEHDPKRLTQSGAVVGTPAYMAPEQVLAQHHQIGPACDIWALGAILYELLTGRPPFAGESSVEILMAVAEREPVPPTQLVPRVPRDLETVCLKCLRKPIPQRYASAGDLADELDRFLKGQPILARPVSPLERGWRWCQRHRAVAALIGMLTVAVLAGTATGVYAWVQTALGHKLQMEKERADENATRADQKAHEAQANAQLLAEEKQKSIRYLYNSQMNLAQRAWDEGDLPRLHEILESQVPEQTGGEDLRGFEWYYCRRLAQAEQRFLKRYEERSWCVAFSRDGRRLAAGFTDGTFCLWEPTANREIHVTWGHARSAPIGTHRTVAGIAFSPDGHRVATASWDKTACLWEASTGQPVQSFAGHTEAVNCVAFGPDGTRLVTGSRDRTARFWDISTGKTLLILSGHTDSIDTVAISADGKVVATGSRDRTVRLWEISTNRVMHTLGPFPMNVTSVAISPDSKALAVASSTEIGIWEVASGLRTRRLLGHLGEVYSVAFCADNNHLVSAGADQLVKHWYVPLARTVREFRGHGDCIRGIAVNLADSRIVSASEDRSIRVWEAKRDPSVTTLRVGNNKRVNSMAVNPQGQQLVSSTWDGLLQLWDVDSGRELGVFPTQGEGVASLAFSADGTRLAGGNAKGVRLWDVANRRELMALKGHNPGLWIYGVAFSPDASQLASTSHDGTVRLWETSTGRPLHTLKGARGNGFGVAYSPTGGILAGTRGDVVQLWDASTGQEVGRLKGHAATITALAFSPSGHLLASASADRTLRLWDVSACRERLVLKGHTHHVQGVAFSPDGRRLASAAGDNTVRLWDVETGHEMLSFKGVPTVRPQIAFTPDGRRLAATGSDAILLWNAVGD